MTQTFFTDTIQSGLIKELLYRTHLPLLQTRSSGDYVVKDTQYIFGDHIIECTNSGIIGNGAEYKELQCYTFGEVIPKITANYVSRFNYYDTDTHYQLGQYLRVLRDVNGIDLLPFYNCFGYKVISGFRIDEDYGIVSDTSNKYKLLAIPIKFNRTYTICIDSFLPIMLMPVLYGDLGLVPDNDTYKSDAALPLIKRVVQASFNRPFTYTVFLEDFGSILQNDELSQEEKVKIANSLESNLYLVMQVSSNNNSSILVQEGDYTKTATISNTTKGSSVIISTENINSLDQQELNKTLLSPLSLQRMNTGTTYAFSDRLIEYLLLNVIDAVDTIGDNIEKAQEKVLWHYDKYTKGVWDNLTRYRAFTKYAKDINSNKNTLLEFIDINGFIDKDIGALISL